MKILVIAEAFPYPPVTGDRIRVFNLIRHLARFHEVYLTAFLANEEEKQYVAEMNVYCREVRTVTAHRISKIRHLPGVVKAVCAGQPLDSKFVFCRPMASIIRDMLERNRIDLVQIEHSFMAEYLKAIPQGYPAKKVLTFHNVAHVQYRRLFQTEKRFFKKVRNLQNWLAMETWEPRMAGLFDLCLAVSETDRAALLKKNSGLRVSVAPNGVDTRRFTALPSAAGHQMLFVGKLNYRPNSDAVLYFTREIFPIVQAELPDATFTVVGPNPPEDVRALSENPSIRVAGFADDLVPYYQGSRLTVVPLRSGGGTRLKILESMAMGRPVVSTTVGCEGIEAAPDTHVCLADNATSFAAGCIRLLTNPEAWRIMAEKGRELAETRYSWERIGEDVRAEYERLAGAGSEEDGRHA